MDQYLSRRALIGAGLAFPLLTLPGCAGGLGSGFGVEDAIRRLLTLSSQRAFATLLTDEGFFQDDLARVQLPSQLGSSTISRTLAIALGMSAVQDRLLRLVNRAAADAADAAAPIVYDSIRSISFGDAMSLVRGGPTAATDFLQRSMGDAIVDAMFPQVGEALRIADSGLVSRVLRTATGIDFTGLQADVSRKAASGIYRAIGREEQAIRANPQATGDAVLIGVFGLLGR